MDSISTKTETNPGRPKKATFGRRLSRQWQLVLMSVPMICYVLLFNYGPLWGWITAFQDYKPKLGITGRLFGRKDFLESIRNTLGMSVINLTLGTVTAILLAVLLNEVRHTGFKRFVQTITYLPHFLSMVIVVGMAQNVFASNGPLNQLLLNLRLIKQPIFFLGEGSFFWWLVGIINVWKEVGWNTIIYIAAMTAIDPTLYEAAVIDGAGRFNRIRYVTLPGIKSTFVILLIMNIGRLMEAGFELQYLLSSPLTVDWAQTIDIFVLKYGISKQQYGVATAAGMFKSVVAIILLFSANAIAKKLDESTLI